MYERRHKCPYCFEVFHTSEDHDDVEFGCTHCGNDFTLREARRGKPDAAAMVAEDVAVLRARVVVLEERVAQLAARLSRSEDRTLAF